MAAEKTVYSCADCGAQSPAWMGRCPECGKWGTMAREAVRADRGGRPAVDNPPQAITDIDPAARPRISTGIAELDRVLGGGLVPGMTALVGGDPGIGKSTLMLQMAHRLAAAGLRCLYVTGEESPRQIKLRAQRLGAEHENVLVLAETDLAAVLAQSEKTRPGVMVVDSIQTMSGDEAPGAAGSVAQVRECAARLAQFCKQNETPLFLVGHITKSGAIAGPKLLEHMVDCVLYFEGDRTHAYRILRARKNRFGPTDEIAVFEMTASGLAEVANPSAAFLSLDGEHASSGTAIVAAAEGTRALLVEIQALTARAPYGSPARRVTGVDSNRVAMLLAVLDRRVGLGTESTDVFVNAVGGMRVDEPAADLGIALAVAGSLKDKPLPKEAVFIGEVGLGGELRAVPLMDARVREAQKLGFKTAFVSHANSGNMSRPQSIELRFCKTLAEVMNLLFRE